MKFAYETYINWLREEAAKLAKLGFSVDTKENAAPVRSLLLKAANSNIEAELVVWENGSTSMMVFNLDKNNYELDQHDIVLSGNQFDHDLALFFKLLK